MGSVYRRTIWHCTTCKVRLHKTADRESCQQAGHDVAARKLPTFWIKYSRAGKSYAESSKSERKRDARALLQDREGDVVKGKPVTPQLGRTTFAEAAADLLADYVSNGKRSLGVVERRVRKHLEPYFGGRRLVDITTTDVRAYIVRRQTEPRLVQKARTTTRKRAGTVVQTPEKWGHASNAEINRELALLKRMFTLAVQAAKVLYRPHVPLLRENNVRTGFFEPEQFASVLAHLPADIKAVIEFAHITGWRIKSEVLPLEWRQIDFEAGEVRLEPGTTKNREGRTFPMTASLRILLLARHVAHERLKKAGQIVPWVFFREIAEGRGGDRKAQPIVSFTKAWKSACKAAACPGRIPHDLRRTAIRGLVRAGIPERVAMQMTGHKTRSVFERYNITSAGDLREAARKLDVVESRAELAAR